MATVRDGQNVCRVPLPYALRFSSSSSAAAANVTIEAMAPAVPQAVISGEYSRRGLHVVAAVAQLLTSELAIALAADVENAHMFVPRARGHVLSTFLCVVNPETNTDIRT